MTIYLIRHTKVAIKPGICYGQSDVGLADRFNKEAKIVQDKIANIRFDKIYSSPLSRCRKLSKFLFDSEVIYDDRLMELNFGDWELKEWDNIRHPQFNYWMDNFVSTPCPKGESFIDLHDRVKVFLVNLKRKKDDTIAIITHGGVIRSFFAHLNNEDLKDAFKREINYGEIIQLEISEKEII